MQTQRPTAAGAVRRRAAAARSAEHAAAVRSAGAGHLVLRTDADWLRDLAAHLVPPAPHPRGRAMSFLAPGRLWLLLLVAALAAVYLVQARRRSRYAVRFTDLDLLASVAPRRPGWRRHVPAGLLALALVALTVGFARPQGEVEVPRERATVLVALDTSLSMNAVDVEPDRDTAARRAATRFVEDLPERFNVGLVSFSGIASLVVPPTQEHDAVSTRPAGPRARLGHRDRRGGARQRRRAARWCRATRTAAGPPPARIVLLSDGTNTVGRPVEAAVQAAREAGVPVSTIAFGTQEGVVEVDGTEIAVPVDRAALRALAEATGGTAYEAESGDALEEVYADIGSQVGTTTEQREVTARWTGPGAAARGRPPPRSACCGAPGIP